MTLTRQRLARFAAFSEHAIYGKPYREIGKHWQAECRSYIRENGEWDEEFWRAETSQLFLDQPTSRLYRNIVFLMTALAKEGEAQASSTKGKPMMYATVTKTENGYKILHRHKDLNRAEKVADMKGTEKKPVHIAELNEKGEVARLVKKEKKAVEDKPKAEAPQTPKAPETIRERLSIPPAKPTGKLGELATKLENLAARFREIEKNHADSNRQLAEVVASLGEVKKSA